MQNTLLSKLMISRIVFVLLAASGGFQMQAMLKCEYIHQGIREIVGAESTTPLHWATKHGNLEEVKILIERKVKIDDSDGMEMTPLMSAVYNDHPKIVKLLIDHEANVNAEDIDDGTALMMAILMGQENIIKMLLDAGATLDTEKFDAYQKEKESCDFPNKPADVQRSLNFAREYARVLSEESQVPAGWDAQEGKEAEGQGDWGQDKDWVDTADAEL